MSEKVIRNNQTIVPFFGQRMSFIRGLDPLGLQNTSDSTFSMLLPGLNNVTGRVRYYSFYCWLLDEYSERIGSTDPEVQRKFIRTAEYIIALSSQYYQGDNGSIPGSNYAKEQIQIRKVDQHNLNEGIFKPDGSTAETYWNFGWGAFGQYYVGSIRDIGIIIDRESAKGVYARTNSNGDSFISGEMLAKAFDKSIPIDKKEIFFNSVSNGFISQEDLTNLLPEFNLAKVPKDSEEQELLLKLLGQKDYPLRIEEDKATFRKETIYHLLSFLETQPTEFNDRAFVYSAYINKGLTDSGHNSSLLGWYYYQFNEFWHYANTSILNGSLAYLENDYGPDWVPLKSFVDDISAQIQNKFIDLNLIDNDQNTLVELLSRIEGNEFEFFNEIRATKRIDRVVNGLLLMLSLYVNNKSEIVLLKEYGENNNLAKDGEGLGYFLQQFKPKLDLKTKDFIFEYILKNVIYRHQYVAFRKIRGGGLSTQKFIIESHHIRYLGNFEPAYTGPRVGNLISFLKDLNAISENNKLTEIGINLKNKLTPTHD